MKCDYCELKDAVVHLTQVENDEARIVHLCEDCAGEKGLQTLEPLSEIPLAGFLANIGKESAPESEDLEGEGCGFCGLTYSGFREAGRLGCPQCYESFEPQLRGLLRRVHGATQHVGKVCLPPDPTEGDRVHRISALRARLDRAVLAEDFERAAELRDEIHSLESVS